MTCFLVSVILIGQACWLRVQCRVCPMHILYPINMSYRSHTLSLTGLWLLSLTSICVSIIVSTTCVLLTCSLPS